MTDFFLMNADRIPSQKKEKSAWKTSGSIFQGCTIYYTNILNISKNKNLL